MKTTEIKTIKLEADEGKVLTDGNKDYGDIIFLGLGRKAEEFYEITREEYEYIIAKQEAEMEVM